MIIKSPIDLELTQSSGQTSQDPWMKLNDKQKEKAPKPNREKTHDKKTNDDCISYNRDNRQHFADSYFARFIYGCRRPYF